MTFLLTVPDINSEPILPDLTKEPIYWADLEVKPPILRMCPDATGYITTNGQIVYYGHNPLGTKGLQT